MKKTEQLVEMKRSSGSLEKGTTDEALAQPQQSDTSSTPKGGFLFPLKPDPEQIQATRKQAIARKAQRLKECEALWRQKRRFIDSSATEWGFEEWPWEKLRPMLDTGYEKIVKELVERFNNEYPDPPVIIYNNDKLDTDGVLANLLRAWYNLPTEHDILMFVNDEAKFAYFIPNLNPYMTKGQWLGWSDQYWKGFLPARRFIDQA
jgi:hypothetical protein